jgi:hypothetical protein
LKSVDYIFSVLLKVLFCRVWDEYKKVS